MNMNNTVNIPVVWEDMVGDRAELFSAQKIYINGHPIHLCAYRVDESGGIQRSATKRCRLNVERLQDINGGALDSFKIDGFGDRWIIGATGHGK